MGTVTANKGGASAAQNTAAGFFEGIEEAGIKTPNLDPGSYLLEIKEVKAIRSFKKKRMVIIEAIVLEAQPGSTNRVGQTVSRVINLENGDVALGELKSAVAAAANVPAETVTAAHVEGVCGPAQPLRGQKFHADAKIIKTRGGGDFTRVAYTPAAAAK